MSRAGHLGHEAVTARLRWIRLFGQLPRGISLGTDGTLLAHNCAVMQMQPSRADSRQTERSGSGPFFKVSELMCREVAVISPDSTVKEAVVVMAKHGVDAIAVVDAQKRLIGFISQQGIAIRALTGDKSVNDLRVGDAMSKNSTSLSVSATVSDALRLMVQRRSEWLPVVTRDHLVVGMLALSDIVSRTAPPRDSRGAWLEIGYRSTARRS